MKFLINIISIVEKINRLIAYLVSALLPLMTALLVYETISRYVFNKPTIWVYDVSIFLFGYIGILGGAFVYQLNGHINVDILYSILSKRKKATLDVISNLLVLFFLVIAIVFTFENGIEAIKNAERTMSEWGPPVGHYRLMVCAGCFFMFLQVLVNMFRSFYYMVTGRCLEDEC
jgi:TRAP-type C4-dicarboxylate transport system permease small subunit